MFSQNLKTPDVFMKKNLASEMQKFYTGSKSLVKEIESTNSSYNWIVYSDRKDNILYSSDLVTRKTDGGKPLKVGFFDAFFVQDVKYKNGQNYLKIHKIGYENQVWGWVNAKKLVLSQHCLLTDVEISGSRNTVPVPKKAMILVSLNELKNDLGVEEIKTASESLAEKVYYHTPLARESGETGKTLTKFQIYFVYKYDSENKSYLLGRTDELMGRKNQSTEMLGWTASWTITDWSTRVCFEPVSAVQYHDVEFVRNEPGLLPGYENENYLFTGLNSGIYPNIIDKKNPANSKSYIISFRAELIRNNRMRMPLLEEKGSVWENPENSNDVRQIYNVVSIAKDNTMIDEKNKDKYARQLDQLTKFQKDVNIIFAIDATGSMANFKTKIAESLSRIEELNEINQDANLSFGFIFYRDYNDGGPELGKKLSLNSTNREQVALEYLPLYPATPSNISKFKKIINTTQFGSKFDSNELTNEPEALFNGLINGLSGIFESNGSRQSEIYKTHSNVLVLIGDCGNYKDENDKKNYNLDKVSQILNKYNMNVITFQVNNEGGSAYTQFFLQGRKLGYNVGKDWIKGKEGGKLQLRVKWIKEDKENQKVRKLHFYSENQQVATGDGSENFTPIFSKLVIANRNTEFTPSLLKKLIEESFEEYMDALSINIRALTNVINSSVEGQEPTPLLIAQIMEIFDFTENQARDWIKKQEITVEALMLQYYLPDVPAVQRVAFLTENQLNELVGELEDNMLGKQYGSKKSDFVNKRKDFQNGLIKMVETLIGSTGIGNLTINDAWKVIFGAPFDMDKYKRIKNMRISTLSTLKGKDQKQLDEFIDYFFDKTKQFIKKVNTYSVSDPYLRRKFNIVGVDGAYYWVPLKDLPATTN